MLEIKSNLLPTGRLDTNYGVYVSGRAFKWKSRALKIRGSQLLACEMVLRYMDQVLINIVVCWEDN